MKLTTRLAALALTAAVSVAALPAAPASASGWTTIVDDQFTTSGVPAHWSVYNGPYGSGAHNCAAPSQVQVPGDGYLHLKMEYLSAGNWCSSNTAAWFTGGMQISSASGYRSNSTGDQAVEVRFRIVRDDTSGVVRSHFIVPMQWPTTGTGYGGEADYCEGGSSLTGCTTFLHYNTGSSTVQHSYTGLDLSQWTTIRAERLNHQVDVFIDGTLKWTYVGDSTTLPDKVLATVLQQECPSGGCPAAGYAAYSEDIQIDYVKIDNPA